MKVIDIEYDVVIMTRYNIGDLVTLKTDKDKDSRIITKITICQNKSLMFALGYGSSESWHYEIEID